MGAVVGELMSSNDATLLGRQTYDEFAGYWPNADPGDPMTGMMNGARKYVVSDSLTEATWANSSVISGDVKAKLTRLKADTGLGTTGSATLVRWMLEHGLVDELHLLVHPIVVGHGMKRRASQCAALHATCHPLPLTGSLTGFAAAFCSWLGVLWFSPMRRLAARTSLERQRQTGHERGTEAACNASV